MLGSFGSGKFYSWFHGNYVLVVALLWVGAVLVMLSFCTRIWVWTSRSRPGNMQPLEPLATRARGRGGGGLLRCQLKQFLVVMFSSDALPGVCVCIVPLCTSTCTSSSACWASAPPSRTQDARS